MTPLDPRFTPSLVAMAQASHKKFWPRGPFVSLSLAQWALESGYGAHMSGVNNPFGIQATKAQRAAGQARLVLSHEWNGSGYVPKEEWFANYNSLEDAFDAHAVLLTEPHYQRCILAETPAAYALALHDCGYATAPNYAEVLMAVITANNLTQFDQDLSVPPAPAPVPPVPASAGAAPKGNSNMPGPGITAAQNAAAAAPAVGKPAIVQQAASNASTVANTLSTALAAAPGAQTNQALQAFETAVSTALIGAATAVNPILGDVAGAVAPEAVSILGNALASLFDKIGADVPSELSGLLAKL